MVTCFSYNKRMKRHLKTVALCLVCLLIIMLGQFFSKKSKSTEQKVQGYKQILELWHIDSFDGGIGSRKDFLLSSAVAFEKKNNVIVSVISHTIQSAQVALEKSLPDMISCGNGLNISNLKTLPISSNYGVCSYNGNNYGTAWARGVYALIGSGEKKNLIVSQGEYTQPLLALEKSGIKFDSIEILPSSKAYGEYLRKGGYLLGTQRDVYRLFNRQAEFEYQALGGYSDLFQVISVTTENTKKVNLCIDFIAYLLSSSVQKNLAKIGMFSTMGHTLYKGQITEKLEQAEIKEFTSFLTSPEKLKQMQKDSFKKLQGA